jgi:hypothetical protein
MKGSNFIVVLETTYSTYGLRLLKFYLKPTKQKFYTSTTHVEIADKFWNIILGREPSSEKRTGFVFLDIQFRMVSSGMLRRVTLVRTDVSKEISASFIRVTRIGELETTLAVTSNRRTLRRLIITASIVSSSPILVTLMKEALNSFETWFLQESHGVTSQKTPLFIVATARTSNLRYSWIRLIQWTRDCMTRNAIERGK